MNESMNIDEFQKEAHKIVDWIADYYRNIESYPVKSTMEAGSLLNKLPQSAPESGEDFSKIFKDFEQMIIPGVTHWQHPGFFAFFPSNSSYPSLLAELLVSALALQCMSWETSPAATELEERMMDWLRDLWSLPKNWSGVIQDTASTSTLLALLSAREKASEFCVNEKGFYDHSSMRIYASQEAHSSVEKAAKVLGFGRENFIKIPTLSDLSMNTLLLKKQITDDKRNGMQPTAIVAALGTTSTTAFDDLSKIAEIAQEEKIWLHVDAAYAGSAFILPELRHYLKGVEAVDSMVINPHKWFFTHFDCSAYFVKDPSILVRSLEILPEYLKAQSSQNVKNYRDWGLALGRRFRALKLWFVMRSMGLETIREHIRTHIQLAQHFEKTLLTQNQSWKIVCPSTLNLVCFRWHDEKLSPEALDKKNEQFIKALNATGKFYLSHTRVEGRYTLRFVAGQRLMEKRHVDDLLQSLQDLIVR